MVNKAKKETMTKSKKLEKPLKAMAPKAMSAKAVAPKLVQKPGQKLMPKMATKLTAATSKSAKKLEPKVKLAIEAIKGKGDKKSDKLELKATELTANPNAEEEEDELDMASSSAGASESGLAMAAATAGAETAAGSLKNFRHHPDIENYYRFIYENDLRYEALEIIDVIVSQRSTQKTVKLAKNKSH